MKVHTLSWVVTSIIGTVAAIPLQQDVDWTYFFTLYGPFTSFLRGMPLMHIENKSGDSYSTTKFDIREKQPSVSNPMGNPKLGKGTTAGGPNWVGYLTTVQNTTRILSYNMAVGGATIDNSLVKDTKVDVTKQVGEFQKAYSNKTQVPWTAENAVFGIWVGINDIGHSFSDVDFEKFTPKLISRYKSLVETLYRDGGRKFLFINVPPTTRTPEYSKKPEQDKKKHAKYVSYFNDKLEAMVKDVAKQDGANVVLYDSFSFMKKVMDNPRKYGFPDATCINKDGKTCLWWNDYHPSSKYHQLQAKDMKPHLGPLGAW